jgi:hypothetical protein
MKGIRGKVFTVSSRGRWHVYSPAAVARDAGRKVDTFEQLVEYVSILGFKNSRYNLLFRGQHQDYLIGSKPQSSLYPSIWRLEPYERRRARERLESARLELLKSELLERNEVRQLRAINERPWAVLQHYGLPTPLLDLTQSLRVAATFATRDLLKGNTPSANEYGFLFVLGMPNLHEGTTISLDEGLIIMRLQSVCPSCARRPHLQSGYLAGSFPTSAAWKHRSKNFAVRLLAKFRLPTRGKFWNIDNPMSVEALYPGKDILRDEIERIKKRIGE